MKPEKIETWKCGGCGSVYLTKESAETCCDLEKPYCEKCGKTTRHGWMLCPKCRWEKSDEIEDYDFPLHSDALDKWFFNEEELEIGALDDPDNDYNLEELFLFCCNEIRPDRFDIRDYLQNTYLIDNEIEVEPDDIISSKILDEVENDVNEIVEAMPSSYSINWKKRPKISKLEHLYHPESKHYKTTTKTGE
jgi:hypothetical protein